MLRHFRTARALEQCYTYARLPMSSPRTSTAAIYRFGVFEVNSAAGELRKSGVRIRLQEQPFQVLLTLLERPGGVVTREELQQKLWPADTFVDFDHSLNTAVNKLREALGDSAANPRYIETMARRGYRFLAAVQLFDTRRPAEGPVETPTAREDERDLHPDLDVPLPRRGVTRALFGLIQVMYLAFYLAALFRLPEMAKILDSSLSRWMSDAVFVAALITAGMGIPLRCYLLAAVAFDYQGLADKFLRIFLGVLVLDQLWAIAPFLLTSRIGFGGAFAATAALLYVPFSQRTLLRMAYVTRNNERLTRRS
jgi:cholera toxin transcriptional activator